MAHRILTSLVGIDATFSSTLSLTSLAGVGNRMLIVNSAGTVSTQAIPTGTVTSVGLSMPSAFTVTNSPVTGAGTLTVTGAGSTLQYIDGTGALQTFPTTLPSTKVQHQVKAGVAINKGQAVYVTSADGTNMIVGLASNDTEATSSKTMGLLDATVSINGFANVVTEGLLAGLDTTAATSAGDPVWLGTNGNLLYGVANKPSAPSHMVFIGIVTRINVSNGEIFVKVQNGFELQELHNVQITSTPADNTVLSYETSSSLYKMKSIATLLGYTPVSGTGTTNYIPKFTGSTALGNSLVYDNGTNIGIGTTSPSYKLDINGTARTKNDFLNIDNSSNVRFKITDNTATGNVYTFLSRFDNTKDIFHVIFPNGTLTSSNVNWNFGMKGGANTFSIASYDGTSVSERILIYNNGNVGIGTSSDAGYKLNVNGTSLINGQITYTQAYTGATTSRIGLFLNDGNLSYSNSENWVLWGTNAGANSAGIKAVWLGNNGYEMGLTFHTATGGNGAYSWPGGSEVMRLLNNKNVLIGASGGSGDSGFKLHVVNNGYYTAANGSLNAGNSLYVVNSGSVGIGTSSPAAKLQVTGSITAATALAQGVYFNNTLVAAANNDVLVGLDINNTFTNGAYTGLSNYSIRTYNKYKFETLSDLAHGLYWSPANDGTTLKIYGSNYSGGMGYLQLNVLSGGDGLTVNGSSRSLTINAAQSNISLNTSTTTFYSHGTGEAMRIVHSTRNVLIGTTTDAGQKLQIAGNQYTTIAGTGDGFNLTRTGNYDNTTLTTLATITDTTTNANRAKTGLYVNVTGASTNIAIQTVGAIGVGVTPPSNSFASGYFSYLYAGATVNSAGNYNLNVRSTVSSYAAGNGGGISFWGDDRGQAGANTAFAGVRGVKENSTYLNGLGALIFLTQASSTGLSTESTFAEVGRFTSGGNFGIGTTTPSYKLDVNGTVRATAVITDTITTSASTTLAGYSGGAYTYGPITANQSTYTFTFGAFNVLYGNISSGYVPKANTIGMGNSAIYNSGSNNVLIGSTTDNGNKLQVNGSVTVSTNLTINASSNNGFNLDVEGTASFLETVIQNYPVNNNALGGITSFQSKDNLNYNFQNGSYSGETISGVLATNVQAGQIVFLRQSALAWDLADATTTGKSISMLGIACSNGSAGSTITILLNGFFASISYFSATAMYGVPMYLHTTGGQGNTTAPSSTGNVVRVIGHVYDWGNTNGCVVLRFNPDNFWLVI